LYVSSYNAKREVGRVEHLGRIGRKGEKNEEGAGEEVSLREGKGEGGVVGKEGG